MPSGMTFSASAIAGTAVLTTVESSACMKNAAATSHNRPRNCSREEMSGRAAETVAGIDSAGAAAWGSAAAGVDISPHDTCYDSFIRVNAIRRVSHVSSDQGLK